MCVGWGYLYFVNAEVLDVADDIDRESAFSVNTEGSGDRCVSFAEDLGECALDLRGGVRAEGSGGYYASQSVAGNDGAYEAVARRSEDHEVGVGGIVVCIGQFSVERSVSVVLLYSAGVA